MRFLYKLLFRNQMGNSGTILTPGTENPCSPVTPQNDEGFLKHDNFLGEFIDEREKSLARTNLGVYGKEDTMTAVAIENMIAENVSNAINDHCKESDPHETIPVILEKLKGYVKLDGTTPFQAPQKGINPSSPEDLTTKEYVDTKMISHSEDTHDPHRTMNLVREALVDYALACDVYPKNKVYTQAQVNTLIADMVKNDGTTPFKVPQKGVYPKSNDDLATKRYADDVFSKHNLESDPHGLREYVNTKLEQYALADDVYKKSETYSRPQVNAVIEGLMCDVINREINKHCIEDDPHKTWATVQEQHYVKRDGSVPFTAPQAGKPGVMDDDFIVRSQLKAVRKAIEERIDNIGADFFWKTSGPVQTTVGMVEDNTELPSKISFQDIMDAIFYGDGVKIEVPKYTSYGSMVDVTMHVRPAMLIDYVELYQEDNMIGRFTYNDFADGGEHTVKSMPITKNPTRFRMKVFYTNGNVRTAEAETKIAYGVYVGITPKWMSGSTMSIEYMEQLLLSDPTNNKKFNLGDEETEYRIHYKFNTPEEVKSLFIAMPITYPDLNYMCTITQQFPASQFECINNIPLQFPNGTIVMYKIYIFPVGIAEMDMCAIYKLMPTE